MVHLSHTHTYASYLWCVDCQGQYHSQRNYWSMTVSSLQSSVVILTVWTCCVEICSLFSAGNYCPVCGECYSDNDFDSKVHTHTHTYTSICYMCLLYRTLQYVWCYGWVGCFCPPSLLNPWLLTELPSPISLNWNHALAHHGVFILSSLPPSLLQMAQCGKCDRWVHAQCEGMSGKAYMWKLTSHLSWVTTVDAVNKIWFDFQWNLG